jgi:Septum formation
MSDRFEIHRLIAVLAITIACATLSGCSLLSDIPEPNDTPDAAGADTDVFTIANGDCLNDGAIQGEVSSVKVVDCGEAHDSEVYESVVMEDGDFPGVAAVEEAAVSNCTTAFNEFVGLDYESSILNFSYFYPTEESWGQGDREILCTIVDPGVRTTGSLEGAAR